MGEKLCILVVDDSAVNLASAEQKLRDEYEVVTINSGERALRYLRGHKADLILLDIKMEGKDGIETLRELRTMENGRDIPVIMLTSKSDRESILETTRLGIEDYVLKPFDTQDLHTRIRKALHRESQC